MVTSLLSIAAAASFLLPSTRPHAREGLPPLVHRRAQIVAAFDVERLDGKAVEELAVFNWPGLDQKAEPFTQTALAGELLMVYVKNGAAQLSAADEDDRAVSEGELVMISDGEVRWSPTSDGGVTLLSTTTTNRVVDEARLEVENAGLWAKISNSLGAGAPDDDAVEPDDVSDLSLNEAVVLLGAGLAAGTLASFGLKLFTGGG